MKIKINEKLICIPPHISTTWEQVTFLQTKEDPETKHLTLIIHLVDGKVIQISDLDTSLIDIIFSAHIKYLENNDALSAQKGGNVFGDLFQQLADASPKQLMGMPIRFGIGGIPGLEGIEMAFQHNSAQADSPDMPKEVLEKVASIAKMLGGGDYNGFPKPEPHCNCMHCQVSRAIHGIEKKEAVDKEEPVSNEELQFRTWDIDKKGENLYIVTNPLDSQEQYSVYLGSPIGCTCGQSHCEHIKAVLYS